MGVIAAFFGRFFGFIGRWLGLEAGRKLTFSAAYIALYISLVVAFTLTINGTIASLSVGLPQDSFVQAGLSLLPPNATQCITALALAHGAQWLYLLKNRVLNLKVKS